MKTYVYTRVSTSEQTLEQQMNAITQYLNAKGLAIDELVSDEGVSGGVSYKERKLIDLINDMNEGDALVVSEISRLGRSMSDLNKLVNDELKPRKLRLIVISMGLDLNCSKLTAIDEMVLYAFGFSAQIEKEMIQERTRNALEARKKNNIAIGGTNELWGKNTKTDRRLALKKAHDASAQSRKKKAMGNPNNKSFWEFIEDYQEINGKITANTDFKPISEKLNQRNKKTSTGLDFTPTRAKAMYNSLKKIYSPCYS